MRLPDETNERSENVPTGACLLAFDSNVREAR